ncbi:MAG: hypothetical protein N2Z82_02070 [Thermomicrobium sp.]|nr:hypothetical protein [Thermomicrobium sp.]
MTRPVVARITFASLLNAGLLALLAFVASRVRPPVGVVPLLAAEGRTFWLVALLCIVAGTVVFQLLDPMPVVASATASERGVRYEPVPEWPTGWGLAFATLSAGALLLCAYHSALAGLAVVLFGFLAVLVGELARWGLYSVEPRARLFGRLAHTLLLYGLAFVVFAMIYVHKLRSLYSASAVLLLAGMLFLQLTEGADLQLDRRVLYAMVGGLVLAETTWVLNYWPATGWLGGATLLAVFHVLAGLVLARVERTLGWRTVAEYGAMAALAVAVIVWSMLRTRGGL